jgi:5'-3' exoribonuclease 2
MTRAEYMLEYVCGMSFLGNDFLPHSLSVRMREGGHDTMCRTLATLHAAGLRLVRNGKVQRDACLELVRAWAAEEEGNMVSCFSQKYKMRPMAPRNERERLMAHVENLPIEWKAEELIWSKMGLLLPGWQETYYRAWMHEASVGQVCAEYTKGLQWIIDYYLGKPVSYSWYFPWSLPPLWGDLVGALDISGSIEFVAPEPSSPVAPQEQLAMVLPLDSWWLVRDSKLRALPAKAPIYWPKSFGFFSVGKRWLWECEAEVPIMTVERLKQFNMR